MHAGESNERVIQFAVHRTSRPNW